MVVPMRFFRGLVISVFVRGEKFGRFSLFEPRRLSFCLGAPLESNLLYRGEDICGYCTVNFS